MASFDIFSEKEHKEITVPYSEAPEKLRAVLDEFGVAMVTGILDPETGASLELSLATDIISTMDTGKELSENQAKVVQNIHDLGLAGAPAQLLGGSGYMLSRRGLPHGKFAWGCRLHPRVKRVFSILYGVPEESLATGLDNPFYSSTNSEPQTTNEEWLHVDQNTNTGLTSQNYQGLLYVWGSDDHKASTTVIWPRSHQPGVYVKIMEDKYSKARGRNSWGQLVQLNRLQDEASGEVHRLALAGARRVAVPAGSLLLWDSRLTHQGWRSGPRLAMPVIWEPKQRRGLDALARKLWLCATGLPSSHSSTEGRVHGTAAFSKQPCLLEGSDACPPLRPLLVPWCVQPGQEGEWEELQARLWGEAKNAKGNADLAGRSCKKDIEQVLRKEVVGSL